MQRERETKHININGIPELLRITEEAIQLHQSVVLTAGDNAVAVITPIDLQSLPPGGRLPTWDEILALRGAAGSLPLPLPWEAVRRIAAEDRADELQHHG